MVIPKYLCHKEVAAFKIGRIKKTDSPGKFLLVSSDRLLSVIVDANYMSKHDPKVGGYYVRYGGGHESWSPAKEFEEGYTLKV